MRARARAFNPPVSATVTRPNPTAVPLRRRLTFTEPLTTSETQTAGSGIYCSNYRCVNDSKSCSRCARASPFSGIIRPIDCTVYGTLRVHLLFG